MILITCSHCLKVTCSGSPKVTCLQSCHLCLLIERMNVMMWQESMWECVHMQKLSTHPLHIVRHNYNKGQHQGTLHVVVTREIPTKSEMLNYGTLMETGKPKSFARLIMTQLCIIIA